MMLIVVETTKTAEKATKRGYLARLSLGVRGSIDREFAAKSGDRNRRWYKMIGHPGEIFESSRPRWTGSDFVISKAWFGLQEDGSLFELSRAEAFATLESQQYAIATDHRTTLPAKRRLERFAITGVAAIPIDG